MMNCFNSLGWEKDLPSTGAIANVIRQSTADKIKKGIVYTVTNGYLSGMFTHAGYAAGNLLRNILHIPGTAFEAAVGTLRGAEAIGFIGKRFQHHFTACCMERWPHGSLHMKPGKQECNRRCQGRSGMVSLCGHMILHFLSQ
jgi:hypothetical protein